MKCDEKEIEEFLEIAESKMEMDSQVDIVTIMQLLIQKEIITEEEFIETNNKIKEIMLTRIKEKIKQELKKVEN